MVFEVQGAWLLSESVKGKEIMTFSDELFNEEE